MPSSIMNILLDCADPYRLAVFWSEVVGRPLDPVFVPGADEAIIGMPHGQQLYFARVPEPKTVKNRMHVCLQPDISRDAEVERLLALGGTVIADRRNPATGGGWVVMGDPEGNEFCVLRSVAEWPESARS